MCSLIMMVSSCSLLPQQCNLLIHLIRFSVKETVRRSHRFREQHYIQNIQYIIPDSCIPVPEPPIADGSPIITRGQIQRQLIEWVLLPGLIAGISFWYCTSVPVVAVSHLNPTLLLNELKRPKLRGAACFPLYQPAAVLFYMKSIEPLYDKCKMCRQANGIIGKKVIWQPHGFGASVTLRSSVSTPAFFIPLQTDLLNQKRGQLLHSFSFVSSHG